MRRKLLVGIATVSATLGLAASAHAEYGLTGFTATFQDTTGTPVTQAGAHADLDVRFGFTTVTDPETANPVPSGQLRDIEVDLPAGFYGNPQVAATCSTATLVAGQGFCTTDAQVGLITVQYSSDPTQVISFPVYNMAVADDETATFGFQIFGATAMLRIAVRPDGNYALRTSLSNLTQALNIYSVRMTLWGVPADPAHDVERYAGFSPGAASGLPRRPFLTLPARCDPATTTLRARSWQEPGRWLSASVTTPPLTGCDRLRFTPSLTARPTVAAPRTPAGFDIDLSIPQDESVSGVGTPQLRKAVVTLPEGVAISPSSAGGLGSCSDAQLMLGTDTEPSCPDASKIGTVTIDTPLLARPLTGEIVLGTPRPGALFRLFLVARGSGLLLKIPGVARPDARTGRITTTFDGTPQLPFTLLRLHFKSGARAPLSTPATCGTQTTTSALTTWSGSSAAPADAFTIVASTGQ